MKKIFILIILSFLALSCPKKILCTQEVNKFGIHILEPTDLAKAQELVNSSGGDWGWVTVVIRDDDMNQEKWQDFMDECRKRHLVPLVRIATHLEGKNWAKPKKEDVSKWLNFLKNLNWPVKDQYVIIFNEPNQAKEWGGEINPREYSQILHEFTQQFHSTNSNFKILNAGLDLAASNTKETVDAFSFLSEMKKEIPEIFENLDAWASHSYPNHGYLGKPWDTGKTSIRGYQTELEYLQKLGVKKEFDVFITETGWPKDTPKITYITDKKGRKTIIKKKAKYYDPQTAANYPKSAFRG